MSEIKLNITIKDGQAFILGGQGAVMTAMTTNELNRLTVKKMIKFMKLDLEKSQFWSSSVDKVMDEFSKDKLQKADD